VRRHLDLSAHLSQAQDWIPIPNPSSSQQCWSAGWASSSSWEVECGSGQDVAGPNPRIIAWVGIFLYLICHDFWKINGRIKIFDKCTAGAVPYGGRLLPPYSTALSLCRRGARRQEYGSCARAGSAAPGPCRRAAGPNRRATRRQGLFYFF
jgi:hypothetical protein